MRALENQTALVTGAARGIGRAVAQKLAGEGAFVIIHYGSSRDQAESTLQAIEAEGGKGLVLGADLSRAEAPSELFVRIDAELAKIGRSGLDILVNNAGIAMSRNLMDITAADFDKVFAVNSRAPLLLAQEAARRMGEGGRIVNISSMVASKAYYGGAIAYGASKAAVEYMTTAMALTLGPRGITVNAVAPGATNTDFIGPALSNEQLVARLKAENALGGIGQPGDVANVVVFLASPSARWVTGEVVHASGGTLL